MLASTRSRTSGTSCARLLDLVRRRGGSARRESRTGPGPGGGGASPCRGPSRRAGPPPTGAGDKTSPAPSTAGENRSRVARQPGPVDRPGRRASSFSPGARAEGSSTSRGACGTQGAGPAADVSRGHADGPLPERPAVALEGDQLAEHPVVRRRLLHRVGPLQLGLELGDPGAGSSAPAAGARAAGAYAGVGGLGRAAAARPPARCTP